MKRIICAVLFDQENHEGSFNIVLGYCAFQYGILAMLASGCVFADTAKLGVLVLDEVTCKPIEGAKVRGGFKVQARSWSAVKCSPLPNECFKFTDKNGRCKVEGETNCGEAGAAVVKAPEGYYCPSYGQGYDFKRQNVFGIWQPDNLVVTMRLQRVEHPIPLFVKRVGKVLPAMRKTSFRMGRIRCSST